MTFSLRIEPTHAAASEAHRQVRQFLDDLDLPTRLGADAELVVAELTSNAVDQHPEAPIELGVLLSADALYLCVRNRRPPGSEAALPTRSGDDPLADRGRGLAIVDALSDGVWVHLLDSTTSVTCLLKRTNPGDEAAVPQHR